MQPAAPAASAQPTRQEWIAPWREAIVSFGMVVRENAKDTYYAIGSGLIVAVDDRRGAILTARHVVFEPLQGWHPGSIRVRFSWQEHRSITEELGTEVRLIDAKGNNLWQSPADGSDIALVPMPAINNQRPVGAIFPSQFASDVDLYEGLQVDILGFPVLMGQQFLVRPVLRHGIVAWTNPDDSANKPFLVDANLYPGNSGGPVLGIRSGMDRYGNFSVGASAVMLGVVSQGPVQQAAVLAEGRPMPYIDPLTHQPGKVTAQVMAVGGMGMIEPVSKVRELLKQAFGADALNAQSSQPKQ